MTRPAVRQHILLAALLLAMPAVLYTRVVRADPISDFEAMRQSQRRNIEQSIANMPPLGGRENHTIGEIFRLGMEGQNLLARTPLDSTLVPGYARAKVPQFGQPIMVRVVGGADRKRYAAGKSVVPDEFLLQSADYSNPRLITSLSLSQSGDIVFSLSQTQTSPSGSRTIQFLLQKIPSLPGGGGATLIVNESGFRAGVPQSNVTLAAPDCASFLRRHPRAVAQYLMPLLAELGQENVLAPDALLAMQVFPEDFGPDPQARRRVESLLPELNDQDYHRRDEALVSLQQMGAEAAKAIIYMDRSAFTPEQNARVDRALTGSGLISRSEADRLRRDGEFLLNCLYCDNLLTRRSALAEIKSLTGWTYELPEDASPAARTAAVRELRAKMEDQKRSNARTRPQ